MDQWIEVVGRAWICQLYDLECCLDSHHLKWSVGVVFIATNQIVAVVEGCWRWAHRTVQWATTSPYHQGLELVDRWRLCPHVAPDSPVPSDLLLWLLPRHCTALFTRQSRPLHADSRCSAGAPDSPVVHRTVQWIIAELRLENPKLKSLECTSPGAPDRPVRQTREHFGFLFAPFFLNLNVFFLLVCVEPLAPVECII
jgi:hypothetical protein